MKRPALHWQILFALIIAIIYGIIFSTTYQLRESSFEKLTTQAVPEVVQQDLQKLKGEEFQNRQSFENAISEAISKSAFNKHYRSIEKVAYKNAPVSSISWIGDMFLRALKMLIIPLILSSLISGVTNIGTGKNLGRLGLKTVGYYALTSTLAILTGLILVNLIQPGIGADLNFSREVEGLVEEQKSLRDIIVEIIPTNIFQAFEASDMLSIIFFAMVFGFFVTRIDEKPRKFLTDAFNALFDVMMKITMFIIKFTPIGIFGIVAKVVADQDNLLNLMSRMGLYMGTVVLALLIHAFIILPIILRFVGKSRPLRHFKNMSTPLITAFSTSSSGATLPLTMSAVEKNSGVSNKITSFTLPLGATINMDGTALYECVAALFIAQAYGVDLTVIQQFTVVVTALLASIGAAAIPMAGLVMITVILTAVGLPLEGVGLILAVDRILDMFRTATNVWSDSCGAVTIASSEGEKLPVDAK